MGAQVGSENYLKGSIIKYPKSCLNDPKYYTLSEKFIPYLKNFMIFLFYNLDNL